MNELVRRAWVAAAEEALVRDGQKPLASRLCALTGLYRKEIVRLQSLPPLDTTRIDDRYNRSARVVTGWLRDPDFLTAKGRPAVLALEGEDGFAELVRRHSGDMTPRAMLEELSRLGVVERARGDRVRLVERGYVPEGDELDVLQILGSDTADLVGTISHNIGREREERLFQRKVAYLHVPSRHLEPFRRYAARESQALLERLDRWLARRDTEPSALGRPGARLGLGIYQFVEERPAPDEVGDKPGDGDGTGDATENANSRGEDDR